MSLFLALLAASVVLLFRIALELDNTKRKKEALAAASGITNDAVLGKSWPR
jgi:hypothetical protein